MEASTATDTISDDMYLVNAETRKGLPLRSIEFLVDVYSQRTAMTRMRQVYVNEEKDQAFNTDFYFPVDIAFALSKIVIEFSDLNKPEQVNVVETVMVEREKAAK